MITRGFLTKSSLFAFFIGALTVLFLGACNGDDSSSGDSSAGTGDDQAQVQALIRQFQEKTTSFDADGSFALLCESLRDRSDLDQIRQNMEGFKNIGEAAPQISNLQFTSVSTEGDEGEARYTYRQVFRGETTVIQEGVKVAKEDGDWCIKDQLAVTQ